MAGRLTKTKAKLVNGKCFNYACDVKLNCKIYDKNPTTKQKKNYPALPMEFCPLFVDNDPITETTEEKNRPYLDSY